MSIGRMGQIVSDTLFGGEGENIPPGGQNNSFSFRSKVYATDLIFYIFPFGSGPVLVVINLNIYFMGLLRPEVKMVNITSVFLYDLVSSHGREFNVVIFVKRQLSCCFVRECVDV